MLEGLVRKTALDFDVVNIAKAAKGSKEAKIAEVGSDIELLTKQSWIPFGCLISPVPPNKLKVKEEWSRSY